MVGSDPSRRAVLRAGGAVLVGVAGLPATTGRGHATGTDRRTQGTGPPNPEEYSAILEAAEGNGTEADPYVLTDVRDVQAIEADGDAHYELGADVDASPTAGWHASGEPYDIEGEVLGKTDNLRREYALDFAPVVDGSERLWIDYLDDQTYFSRDEYAIDYESGRIVFDEPPGEEIDHGQVLVAEYQFADSLAEGLSPVSEFTGVLDGNGHRVTGLHVARPNESKTGLFGENYGVVRHLTVRGTRVHGGARVGALAGQSYGSFRDVTVDGAVSGGDNVGGMVGWMLDGDVRGGRAAVTVDGSTDVGGIAGSLQGEIRATAASGNVTGGTSVGGFFGMNYNDDAPVEKCYATGDVTGHAEVGGFGGYMQNVSVSKCYATGDVTGTDSVGGFVGWLRGVATECYSAGSVSGESRVGGFSGRYSGLVEDCYWDRAAAGVESSPSATGLGSTHDDPPVTFMTGAFPRERMDGFDFEDTWTTVPDDYPALLVFGDPNVEIDDASGIDATVEHGSPVDVTVSVINSGGRIVGPVTLVLDGSARRSRPVALTRQERTTVTFAGVETGGLEPGDHDVVVRTGQDEVSGTLTVESSTATPGPTTTVARTTATPTADASGPASSVAPPPTTGIRGETATGGSGPGFGLLAALGGLATTGYLAGRRSGDAADE